MQSQSGRRHVPFPCDLTRRRSSVPSRRQLVFFFSPFDSQQDSRRACWPRKTHKQFISPHTTATPPYHVSFDTCSCVLFMRPVMVDIYPFARPVAREMLYMIPQHVSRRSTQTSWACNTNPNRRRRAETLLPHHPPPTMLAIILPALVVPQQHESNLLPTSQPIPSHP